MNACLGALLTGPNIASLLDMARRNDDWLVVYPVRLARREQGCGAGGVRSRGQSEDQRNHVVGER
jgi:hypothetical protein